MRNGQVCSDGQVDLFEARNGLRQFDAIHSFFETFDGQLKLNREIVRELNRLAIEGIYSWAGEFRKGEVEIRGSQHEPPSYFLVPALVDEMCEYANSVGDRPIHCSAYLMWKLNWIHPFFDGNGRTSRAVSYLALCVGHEMDLPGTLTVPDQIARQKAPYYKALDDADAAWKDKKIDVSSMEQLIEKLLVRQLETAV